MQSVTQKTKYSFFPKCVQEYFSNEKPLKNYKLLWAEVVLLKQGILRKNDQTNLVAIESRKEHLPWAQIDCSRKRALIFKTSY